MEIKIRNIKRGNVHEEIRKYEALGYRYIASTLSQSINAIGSTEPIEEFYDLEFEADIPRDSD